MANLQSGSNTVSRYLCIIGIYVLYHKTGQCMHEPDPWPGNVFQKLIIIIILGNKVSMSIDPSYI